MLIHTGGGGNLAIQLLLVKKMQWPHITREWDVLSVRREIEVFRKIDLTLHFERELGLGTPTTALRKLKFARGG